MNVEILLRPRRRTHFRSCWPGGRGPHAIGELRHAIALRRATSANATLSRFNRGDRLGIGLCAILPILLVACGGSTTAHRAAPPPPQRHHGWQVVYTKTVTGPKVGATGGRVAHPAALEVKVVAHPPVISQIDYSIDCEASATHPVLGTIRAMRTPVTAAIPIIPRAASCFLYVTASKSSDARLTITVLGKGTS